MELRIGLRPHVASRILPHPEVEPRPPGERRGNSRPAGCLVPRRVALQGCLLLGRGMGQPCRGNTNGGQCHPMPPTTWDTTGTCPHVERSIREASNDNRQAHSWNQGHTVGDHQAHRQRSSGRRQQGGDAPTQPGSQSPTSHRPRVCARERPCQKHREAGHAQHHGRFGDTGRPGGELLLRHEREAPHGPVGASGQLGDLTVLQPRSVCQRHPGHEERRARKQGQVVRRALQQR
mmetsp:Transcript_2392/g.9387  ORF Transcript_2392/g.9387 Transcript_2392/m.9387 type:complete len:234 (-) Transcript_2392:429-1130(-)